jgi:uncharacterized membrane protein YphA (DoxX/SURF4 family)
VRCCRCARYTQEILLQCSFPAFPDGLPGIALLLLRVVLATVLLIQGSYCLREPGPSTAMSLAGVEAFVLSGLLFVGFLTPLACALVGLCAIAIKLSWIPACAHNVVESYVSAIFAATVRLGTMILGPGAFSVDPRIYGRREIIIPPRSPQPR